MRVRWWRRNGVAHSNGHSNGFALHAGSSEPWILHECLDCHHRGLVVYPEGSSDCCDLAAGEAHPCAHHCPWSTAQAPHLEEGHRCRGEAMPVIAASDPFHAALIDAGVTPA